MKRMLVIGSAISFFGAFVASSTYGASVSLMFVLIGILLLSAYFLGDKP